MHLPVTAVTNALAAVTAVTNAFAAVTAVTNAVFKSANKEFYTVYQFHGGGGGGGGGGN